MKSTGKLSYYETLARLRYNEGSATFKILGPNDVNSSNYWRIFNDSYVLDYDQYCVQKLN